MKKPRKSFNHQSLLILTILIGLTVILRIPSLFEPNRYADEDIYLTLGQAMRKGLVLYRDIHDNKPPGVYLTAALAKTVFGFRLILMIWHAVNVAVFIWLADLLFPRYKRHELAVFLAGLVFVLLTTVPLLEGNIANGEILMIMPVTVAIWLFWKSWKVQPRRGGVGPFLAVGLLISLGFLFKVTAAFDLAAVLAFLIIRKGLSFKGLSLQGQSFLGLGVGFTAPVLATIVYYVAKGAGEPYIRSALLQNVGYLSSYTGGSSGNLMIFGLVLILLLGGLYRLKDRLSRPLLFVSIWFLLALFGALLSSRPYPHYLIQPAVPGALLVGLSLLSRRKQEKAVIAILTILTISAIRYIDFWHYPSLPYYRNFLDYTFKRKSKQEHDWFFEGVKRNQEIAEYIRTHALPDDRIFIWGTEPGIYAMADRLPVGRFTTSYHIRDFDPDGVTFAQVVENPPPVIIVLDCEDDRFGFADWVERNYVPARRIEDATVYQHFPGTGG